MAKKVIWTPQAEITFEKVLTYLGAHWSAREIEKFISATDKTIKLISKQPTLFRKSPKGNFHEALVTKHNLLIYKVKKESIDLITFWDTRQNPKRKRLKR